MEFTRYLDGMQPGQPEERKPAPRFAMNEVAKHKGNKGALHFEDQERKLPLAMNKSASSGFFAPKEKKVKPKKEKQSKKEPIKKNSMLNSFDEEDEIIELPEVEMPGDIDGEPLEQPLPKRSTAFVHIESPVKIYVTKDYGLFASMAGNRTLNRSKINRIKKDIKGGLNVLKYCPVIVAEKGRKLEIIDGQHRFAVAHELGSYVWYIVAQEMTILDIAKVNSNTEKWKPADYIHCYASQGNEDYKRLQAFKEEFGFNLSSSIQLLTRGIDISDGGVSVNKEAFQAGTFKITKEAEARDLAELVKQFAEFAGHNSSSFITAICKIIKAQMVPVLDVIEAYKANKEMLELQHGYKDYLTNLEVIVNKGKQKRRILY